MTECFSIPGLFKAYIESLDSDVFYAFKQICLGNYTVDHYCKTLEYCMENNTTRAYTVLQWSSKTIYYSTRGVFDVTAVNNIVYPSDNTDKKILHYTGNNTNPQIKALNHAYYHLSNTVDDYASSTVYSECGKLLNRRHQYTLLDFFLYGDTVFLMLPSGDSDRAADESTYDYYKRKYGIDIYDDVYTNVFGKLCNGWYKYFLKAIDIIPKRSVMTIYTNNDNKHLCCKPEVNNSLDERRIPAKAVQLTIHYEQDRS